MHLENQTNFNCVSKVVMTFEMEHLIYNIRTTREGLGYSQEYMAMKLGIGQNGYSKIELGYTRITVERLYEIARILNTDVFTLLPPPNASAA